MIYQERLLKILRFPHISEKSSVLLEKFNTVVFTVARYATQSDVKDAVTKFFSVHVRRVNILVVKGKSKGTVNKVGVRNDWKKAYVILKKGQKIDFIEKIK